MKKHEVNLNINIHHINLTVKFPCKLSVTLKKCIFSFNYLRVLIINYHIRHSSVKWSCKS